MKAMTFTDQLRLALNHLDDPTWLGENSPLAAPYFLGGALPDTLSATAVTRGEILRQTLYAAADSCWPGPLPGDKTTLLTAVTAERQQQGNKGPMYHYLLLELRYFRRFFRPTEDPRPDNDIAVCDSLSISRASYFNHLKAAQQSLAEALLTAVQPTFRLEHPAPRNQPLVGREPLLTQCLATLKIGQSVALSGMGGVGKTALATAVAHAWPTQPVFWFTIRPSFNDHLECLLFSLAYFLHRQGASGLWQQLIADGGQVSNYDLALSLARGDMQNLPHTPLLCLDEIDALYTDAEITTPAHIQMREFLDGLRQVTPVLFIGQQPLTAVTSHITVPPLSQSETNRLLAELPMAVSSEVRQTLHHYTSGNPRLLHLCAALLERGLPAAEVTAVAPYTPAIQALWTRLWQRFDGEEQRLLQMLAVFRSPAPADAWLTVGDVMARLSRRRIIQQDGVGGVHLLPLLRDLILHDRPQFPAERQEHHHLIAAEIRASRGEYTAAAYHYQQAHAEKQAIQLWFPHRQQEIRRGQGPQALALFQQLSARSQGQPEQQALALIRAELYHLQGAAQQGLSALTAVRWPCESEITTQARQLQGDFLNMLGYPEVALDRYEDGMAIIARLLNRLVRYRYERGSIHVQQKRLEAAGREAQLAQYEAAYLQGMVHDENGRYTEAVHTYQQALMYAQAAGHETGVAQIQRALATTLGRQARLEEAIIHATAAMETFAHMGDRLNEERVRSSLAAAYFQAGKFREAIIEAEPAMAFFEAANMPFWTAVAAATLAEAYYENGQLEEAEETAHKVLRLEENQTQPYALYTLGLIARAHQQPDEARQHFQASQQIAQANGDRYLEAYAWRALGELYQAQGNMKDGRKALNTALQQFNTLNLPQETAATQRLFQEYS